MFQPVSLSSGIAGWQFIQRTYDRQFSSFTESVEIKRDVELFRERIASITTAEELVADRQVLQVALGAFGLEADIDNRFFIQKMLDEGTTNDDALANRFTDERYKDFSAAFGFGPGEVVQTGTANFANDIIAKYEAASFEVALGEQDETMRVALYAQRVLSDVVGGDGSTDEKWFTIMAQPPLRTLFETALNLPSQFGQIDIDQQLDVFKERASRQFGSENPADFTETELLNDIIETYVARSQLNQSISVQSSGTIALTLLQNAGF